MYSVILMDPPWKYYGDANKMAAAGKHYNCLTWDEIAANRPPMNERAIVFQWTTSAFLKSSLELFDEWNITYRGVAFVWVKVGKNGKPFGARGVRPSITKPLTEFVVAGSNVFKGRPLTLSDESVTQTVFAPVREHSRKPVEVQESLERMYPNYSKLEMYARETRAGWDSVGNETTKFDS